MPTLNQGLSGSGWSGRVDQGLSVGVSAGSLRCMVSASSRYRTDDPSEFEADAGLGDSTIELSLVFTPGIVMVQCDIKYSHLSLSS